MDPKEKREEKEEDEFHCLPFKTRFEGVTDITENFTSHTSDDGGRVSDFRGRRLLGRELYLPPGYHIALATFHSVMKDDGEDNNNTAAGGGGGAAGVSVVADAPPRSEKDPLCYEGVQVHATASRFTVWEHDRAPENVDSIRQWIALSSVIHTPSWGLNSS